MSGLNVRIWMMEKPLKATKIATGYGCNPSFITKFLNGDKASQDLVDYLVKQGCPKKYFKNGKVMAQGVVDDKLQAD